MKPKYFLVKYTCVCGEFEFGGQTVLTLQPRQKIATQVHNYFCEYYDDLDEANRAEGTYTYNGGAVMVKKITSREITAEQNAVLTELGV